MRKIITLSIVIIVITLVVYLAYGVFTTIQQKKITERNTAVLPAFMFAEINNKPFDNAEIASVKSKIIFNFFNPSCEHCQYMATQYLKNKEQLKEVTILMVTNEDSGSVVTFSKKYQLNTMPNVIFLRDPKYQFEKTFGTSVVPSFFIYRNSKLVKKIIGETKIENLLN